jgi:hypothetical protein
MASRCEARRADAAPLVVLTNMQWFYGATWGSTVRFCDLPALRGRKGPTSDCAGRAEVHERQLELIEVLRRNVLHSAVAEVHVVVGEASPVSSFLSRLPWYQRMGCKVRLVETGTRPSFRTYMELISGPLLGKTVVLTNQDVFLGGSTRMWRAVPHALARRSAFFLSRYHRREEYTVQNSIAASIAAGIFNSSMHAGNSQRTATGRHSSARDHRSVGIGHMFATGHNPYWRMCDMTQSRFSMWRRSLCSSANFGSYDAYVLRLEVPLSAELLDLFNYPQNAWGGENLFLFLIVQALGMEASNPCLDVQAVHMHCQLASSFGAPKVGERRLSKRDIIQRSLAKLHKLGHPSASVSYVDIGKMALKVTGLNLTNGLP